MKLKSFIIKNLYGRKDYFLKFIDNRLVIVGENGAGKTTVLRILFLFLSGQWSNLSKFEFDSISIKLDDKLINLSKSEITDKIFTSNNIFKKRLPPSIRERVEMMDTCKDSIGLEELEVLCSRYGVPISVHTHGDDFLSDNIKKKLETLKSYLDCQILYLPTYRRIEQELGYIFEDINLDDFKRRHRVQNRRFYSRDKPAYTELVEFGMNDVKDNIEKKLSHLKEFTRTKLNSLTLAYLGDVVDKKYDKVDVNEIKGVEDDTVKNILERIDSVILSKSSKNHLVETIKNVKDDSELDEHQKVICHYFSKLLSFQQELEKEEQGIRKFCEVCNNYMSDKFLEYTSSRFSFMVVSKKHLKEIELRHLSSGEKQIVSLFSHLYLSNDANFFLMIDEPELSLSVPWQRMFLIDISTSHLCSGFLAVTHSPFIYENDLEKYAHSLGEFIKEVK
ncbi:ATP-binding protein [Myxococcota bacterium]|nr:ATP-binding protein [Myxococcota bacterium]MBU1379824.1 ATP-binding protein [Myxococcota bacterium]MBU1496992.1 ATP-binding protein [Myxococcota bacterium]